MAAELKCGGCGQPVTAKIDRDGRVLWRTTDQPGYAGGYRCGVSRNGRHTQPLAYWPYIPDLTDPTEVEAWLQS